MASSRERHVSDRSHEKSVLKCCKKKTSAVVCVNCGGVFHKSCATRDWAGKVKFIDETRLICCEVESEVKDRVSVDMEIGYLKRLVSELEKKNILLEENASLWKVRYEALEEKTNNIPIIPRCITSVGDSSL